MSGKEDYDHLVKIVFVGDAMVGKSSILLRFTEGQFDPTIACTVGVDFKVHLLDWKQGLKVNLTIWDTAGQERFNSLTGSYYRGAHAIFVVYDVSKKSSFEHVQTWLTEIETHTEGSDVVKLLIGNKIDLDNRQVQTKEGEAYAQEHSLLFSECSSKDDIGIDLMFQKVINAVLDNPNLASATRKGEGSATQGNAVLQQDAPPPQSNCVC